MLERRKTIRGRTFLGGKIDFDSGFCVVDCMVRNMSDAGARLTFTNTAIVPDEFDVRITKTGQTKHARIIWRNYDQAGVAFFAEKPSAEVVPLTYARRLREAEADRDRLQRKIDEMASSF